MKEQLTLGEIAEGSGLPARTIRFYISRGLLAGPAKSGRGAVYTPAHLEQLERIKALQSAGRTLSEIANLLRQPQKPDGMSEPTAWWQHALAEDVVVWVRSGASPWRTRQIRAAVEEFARRVQQSELDTQKEEEGK